MPTPTAGSLKRVTAKPKTNRIPLNWKCLECNHTWEAGPGQEKCPACDGGDVTASIEGTVDDTPRAKKTNGKIRTWPSGLDSWGTPTWCCPQCETAHRGSVCPKECHECAEPGDPRQSFKGKLPAAAFDRGPIPPVHPASTSTTTPAGIAANDPDATPIAKPVSAAGTVDVDLARIKPSPDNPRKTFPKDEIDELATSIDAKGLQQALEVLPPDELGFHELVDGERRLKALNQLYAKDKARWKTIACAIKPLTRDQARDYRLTTFVRAGLNAIDQARAFQERLDAEPKITQAQLGALVGLTQGAIANKLRLLIAPAGLQAKLISQEMTEKQLRQMVGQYGEAPEVLAEFAKSVKKESLIGRDPDDLYELDDILAEMTRPMVKTGWNATPFKWTEAQEKELDVRTVGKERVAFNIKRWDELATASVKKRTVAGDKAEAQAQEKERTLTPAEIKKRKKKQADIFARKLYRYKIGWLQKRCVAILQAKEKVPEPVLLRLALHFSIEDQQCHERGNDLAKAVAENGGKAKKTSSGYYWSTQNAYESILTVPEKNLWAACQAALARMANHRFCDTTRVPLQPTQFELLAGELGVNINKEWRLDEEFLGLHSGDQLRALQKEWGLFFACGPKRSDLIDALQREDIKKQVPCPTELLETKAVQL